MICHPGPRSGIHAFPLIAEEGVRGRYDPRSMFYICKKRLQKLKRGILR